MSEEDILDIVERVANFGWSDYDNFEENQQAIQGILDLYAKEKEKNKKLKQTIKMLYGVIDEKIDTEKIYKILNKYEKENFILKRELEELLEEDK